MKSLLAITLCLGSTACVFSNVRSAVVSPGPSFSVQGAMTTDVGPEIGWFFGDECSPCEGPLPSLDGNLQYGHVPSSPNGKAFSFAVGVSGLILPYAEGYVQLGGSTSMPYGVGVRVGGIGGSRNDGLRQAHLFGRVDKPLAPGRRLLWNPSVFYHSTSSNGQSPGHIWALVNGFGLELSKGPVALTPSVSLVAARGEHTTSVQPPSSGTKVFGTASIGIAFRRDPYRWSRRQRAQAAVRCGTRCATAVPTYPKKSQADRVLPHMNAVPFSARMALQLASFAWIGHDACDFRIAEEVAMAHTHEYDCIVCGAHLDSSEQLSHHNQELHLRSATGMERPRTDRGGEREEREKREDPLPDREL